MSHVISEDGSTRRGVDDDPASCESYRDKCPEKTHSPAGPPCSVESGRSYGQTETGRATISSLEAASKRPASQAESPTRRKTVARFSNLDIAAVRLRGQRRDRQICLWYALRVVDRVGVGRVDSAAIDVACGLLKVCPRTRQRLLGGGAPAFWTPAGAGGLYLRAPARVAVALNASPFREIVISPVRHLRGAIATVRARLALQGIAAIRRGLPTSNAAIASMVDASARTVDHWKHYAGLRIQPNFRLVAPLGKRTSVDDFFRATGEPGLRAVVFRQRTWLAQQLPNSLLVTPVRGVRSRLRRAYRHFRRLTGARTSSDKSGGGNTSRYHADHRRAHPSPDPSTLHSADMADVPVGAGRMHGQRVSLWERTPSSTRPPRPSRIGSCRSS